jgi:hypothetical protein
MEILNALAHERMDEIIGDTAQTKASDHNGGAVKNVGDRFGRGGDGLIHDVLFTVPGGVPGRNIDSRPLNNYHRPVEIAGLEKWNAFAQRSSPPY